MLLRTLAGLANRSPEFSTLLSKVRWELVLSRSRGDELHHHRVPALEVVAFLVVVVVRRC